MVRTVSIKVDEDTYTTLKSRGDNISAYIRKLINKDSNKDSNEDSKDYDTGIVQFESRAILLASYYRFKQRRFDENTVKEYITYLTDIKKILQEIRARRER